MTTKTKEKQEVKPHPALDFTGADPRLVEHVMTGKSLIVNKPFNRDGVKYQRGDKVVLGQFQKDGFFLRPHPISGGIWVMTPAQWDFNQYDSERRKYERDEIVPKRALADRANTDYQKAANKMAALSAQLKNAEIDLSTARATRTQAQKNLKKAQAGAPKQPK